MRVEFPNSSVAVDGLSLEANQGELVGIVGESGSGKSITLLACLGLVPFPGRVVAGDVLVDGRDMVRSSDEELRHLRGSVVSLVPQDPLSSLHPAIPIGKQLANVVRDHENEHPWKQAMAALEMAGVPLARERLAAYPHQLSGGLRQRVLIAMAIANRPRLLLADEPTTALDVTVQARILELLADLNGANGMTVVLVTHNFGVIAGLCDRTVVMRDGHLLEDQPTERVFSKPKHAYTRQLLEAVPRIEGAGKRPRRPNDEILIRCDGLHRKFATRRWLRRDTEVTAMRDVTFELRVGEALGLVGESGAGKTTVARTIVGLEQATNGQVVFGGSELGALTRADRKAFHRRVQMVFQDPYSSLNPRWSVGRSIAEPLLFHGLCVRENARVEVERLLRLVELSPSLLDRLPRELSGGERQRAAIGRAISVKPALIVADEPVSSLDVSIQADIIRLFGDLQERLGLTLLLVAHDLGLVHRMCDRVAVMWDGELVEIGETASVFGEPQHAYTRKLLAAVPTLDSRARRTGPRHQSPDAATPVPFTGGAE